MIAQRVKMFLFSVCLLVVGVRANNYQALQNDEDSSSTWNTLWSTVERVSSLTGGVEGLERLWWQLQELINQGRHSELIQEAPHVLVPVLTRYLESQAGDYHPHCIQRTMCEANQRITRSVDGHFGNLAARLISELIARTLDRGDDVGYERSVSASQLGREGFNCTRRFPLCEQFKPLFEDKPFSDNSIET